MSDSDLLLGAGIPALLVTSGHVLECCVRNAGRRLSDVLNDPNSEFVQAHQVRISPRGTGRTTESLASAMVRKRNLVLAIPTGAEHEAPEKRRNAYVKKPRRTGYLVAGEFEISGEVQLDACADALYALSASTGHFVPVCHATVSVPADWGRLPGTVVIVNKDFVSLLHLEFAARKQESLSDIMADLVRPDADQRES
jgi:hypothetical protein